MQQTLEKIQTNPINFKKVIADFIFASRYARYSEKVGRRETWEETVYRVRNMHLKKFKHLSEEYLNEINKCFDFVKEKKVVPSMRSLQFGGKAIEQNHNRIYNCSARHIDSIRSFSEIFYLLLCGCGVGFGVTKHFLDRLPNLVTASNKTGIILTYNIEDTIEGWADSLEILLSSFFQNTPLTGRKIIFDYSRIRHRGEPLKTSGGKAPGYRGLKASHQKIKTLLNHIVEDLGQERLKPINAYDIIMHISDAVLSGGIRRSASICIFDKNDEEMMNSKTFFTVDKKFRFAYDEDTKLHHGKVKIKNKTYDVELNDYEFKNLEKYNRISWFYIEPQRARSNNSVLFLRDNCTFEEFSNIVNKCREFGEPGFIFANHPYQLPNPCAEINFIPVTKEGLCGIQFCNLVSINGSKISCIEDFKEYAKYATIIATLQVTYTDLKYLHPLSKQLTEEEALLGVSITGMMDNPTILLNEKNQIEVAKLCIETNRKWASILGINEASRITCVKPEGTSSLLLESSSGIHPHHARQYFRRVQCNKLDPILKFFKKINPQMVEESVWSTHKTDEVITFPIEINPTAIIKKDLTALKHLEIIKNTQQNWVNAGITIKNNKPISHAVSCTVLVLPEEWENVIKYIYENRIYFSGVTLLPKTGDKDFLQAPMEEVNTEKDREKWNLIINNFKEVNYRDLKEEEDNTTLAKESACAGGLCEVS